MQTSDTRISSKNKNQMKEKSAPTEIPNVNDEPTARRIKND